jgi:hypothetical protein
MKSMNSIQNELPDLVLYASIVYFMMSVFEMINLDIFYYLVIISTINISI